MLSAHLNEKSLRRELQRNTETSILDILQSIPQSPDSSTERHWDYILLLALLSTGLFSHATCHFHSRPFVPSPIAYT